MSRPDQVARAAALGVVPVPQGRFVGEIGDGMLRALGPERSGWAYRYRSLLDAGITAPGSSDRPVVDGAPLLGMHDMVNRLTDGGLPCGPDEAITGLEALTAYTHGSAYASHAEGLRGHARGRQVRRPRGALRRPGDRRAATRSATSRCCAPCWPARRCGNDDPGRGGSTLGAGAGAGPGDLRGRLPRRPAGAVRRPAGRPAAGASSTRTVRPGWRWCATCPTPRGPSCATTPSDGAGAAPARLMWADADGPARGRGTDPADLGRRGPRRARPLRRGRDRAPAPDRLLRATRRAAAAGARVLPAARRRARSAAAADGRPARRRRPRVLARGGRGRLPAAVRRAGGRRRRFAVRYWRVH